MISTSYISRYIWFTSGQPSVHNSLLQLLDIILPSKFALYQTPVLCIGCLHQGGRNWRCRSQNVKQPVRHIDVIPQAAVPCHLAIDTSIFSQLALNCYLPSFSSFFPFFQSTIQALIHSNINIITSRHSARQLAHENNGEQHCGPHSLSNIHILFGKRPSDTAGLRRKR